MVLTENKLGEILDVFNAQDLLLLFNLEKGENCSILYLEIMYHIVHQTYC